MREIVFKAKTTAKEVGEFNNVWIEGDLITSNGKYYIHPKNNAVTVSGELGKIIVMHEIEPETISQYTGLCDKNGNKIFENDILLQKTTELHWCQWENSGVVRYGEYDWNESYIGFVSVGFYVEAIVKNGDINRISCGLSQQHINNAQYPTEVIGNVFDNPELLEGN